MPTINRITNPNPLVEEKVNYFLDNISHMTTYAGWHWHLELESPISLLDKIIFRLKNDNKHNETYYKNYFRHSFFTTDTFWVTYKTYSAVKNVVAAYLAASRKERPTHLESAGFLENLESLVSELRRTMVKKLVDGVISTVTCNHSLDEPVPGSKNTHATALRSIAQALVSAYIFKGYKREEIQEIINNVFSKDINTFPFPGTISTKIQRQKHLQEKEISNQLHGFTNAYYMRQIKGKIATKIYGAKFPADFIFRYHDVTFYGKSHPYILRLKTKMPEAHIDDFFVEGDYIIAITEVFWHSYSSLIQNIKMKIQPELHFLSAAIDRNLNIDSTNNYVRFSSRMKYEGMSHSSNQFTNEINERTIKQLRDNVHQILRRNKGIATDWFLQNEKYFIRAKSSNSISDYWQYMEVLLSNNQAEKEVRNKVSAIILLNEKFIHSKRIEAALKQCFYPLFGGFTISKKINGSLHRIIPPIKNGKIVKEAKDVEYPFIQELITAYEEPLDCTYFQKAKEYYIGILTESYEYRNFIVHSGLDHNIARAKLISILPNLVLRLRRIIIDALKRPPPQSSFNLLLDDLVRTGELLCKSK